MNNHNTETPLVTPHKVFSDDGIDPAEYRFATAILVFMPIGPITKLFDGEPLDRKIFSMVNKCWLRLEYGGTLLLGPVYGGPVCASTIEELAVLRVKNLIGFGLSGSLVDDIVPGDFMLAEAGLASDGTTREYASEDEAGPDPALFTLTKEIFAERGLKPRIGKVWTTDAIYREYPSKVACWREKGASFVNMETSPFFAVAHATNIRAVYLSLVSDHVGGEEWTGWPTDLAQGIDRLWEVCAQLVSEIGKPGPTDDNT